MTREDFIRAFDEHLPSAETKQATLQKILIRIDEISATECCNATISDTSSNTNKKPSPTKLLRMSHFSRIAAIVLFCVFALFTASVVYASFGGYIPGITEWVNPRAAKKHKQHFTRPDETILPNTQIINKVDALIIDNVPVQVDLHASLPKEAVSSLTVSPYLITSDDADALINALNPVSYSLKKDSYDLYAIIQTKEGTGTIRFDGKIETDGFYNSYLDYVAGNTASPSVWDATKEHPMTLSEQEAEESARQLLRELGLNNLALQTLDRYSASSSSSPNARHYLSENDDEPVFRYRLIFSPKYEGLTFVRQPALLEPKQSGYMQETIIVEFTSDTISEIRWRGPLRVSGVPSETKELLTFEHMYENFRSDLINSSFESSVSREVYDQLSFGWIRITAEDVKDQFTLIPAVSFHGDAIIGFPDGAETQGFQKYFIYNAITGQRIDPQTRVYLD